MGKMWSTSFPIRRGVLEALSIPAERAPPAPSRRRGAFRRSPGRRGCPPHVFSSRSRAACPRVSPMRRAYSLITVAGRDRAGGLAAAVRPRGPPARGRGGRRGRRRRPGCHRRPGSRAPVPGKPHERGPWLCKTFTFKIETACAVCYHPVGRPAVTVCEAGERACARALACLVCGVVRFGGRGRAESPGRLWICARLFWWGRIRPGPVWSGLLAVRAAVCGRGGPAGGWAARAGGNGGAGRWRPAAGQGEWAMVKQERAARTRQSLVRAAAEGSPGRLRAGLADLDQQAGRVSNGALHFHFASKQDLRARSRTRPP
ncbi:hypothetical protein FBY22_3968, partial [Streptomyces sp. SLBN-31]